MESIRPTDFTRLRRSPGRGVFDRETINAILDATPICHIGYTVEGRPVVTPTCHWREADRLYWHGSRVGRAITSAGAGEVCVTVSHFDGLVLARSGFHHSINYRSVMVFGTPNVIDDDAEKARLLERFVEGLFPGRWDSLRAPTSREMDATTILSLPIAEASAKVRGGPPEDPEADLAHPVWAGVIPVRQAVGTPIPCPHNLSGLSEPDHVSEFSLDRKGGQV